VKIMGFYDTLIAMSDAPEKPKPDVVLLGPPTTDGEGIHVLRAREDRIEAGEVRPVKDGAPIHGEIVQLTPREGAPQVCDVQVTYAPKKSPAAALPTRGKGPAQVATRGYRDRWDEIFGKATAEGEASPGGPSPKLLN
jgi:hypothetical protein